MCDLIEKNLTYYEALKILIESNPFDLYNIARTSWIVGTKVFISTTQNRNSDKYLVIQLNDGDYPWQCSNYDLFPDNKLSRDWAVYKECED